MGNTYKMAKDEIEAAVYNWLAQSGSHVINKFPDLEPLNIIHSTITIEFIEDVGEK